MLPATVHEERMSDLPVLFVFKESSPGGWRQFLHQDVRTLKSYLWSWGELYPGPGTLYIFSPAGLPLSPAVPYPEQFGTVSYYCLCFTSYDGEWHPTLWRILFVERLEVG